MSTFATSSSSSSPKQHFPFPCSINQPDSRLSISSDITMLPSPTSPTLRDASISSASSSSSGSSTFSCSLFIRNRSATRHPSVSTSSDQYGCWASPLRSRSSTATSMTSGTTASSFTCYPCSPNTPTASPARFRSPPTPSHPSTNTLAIYHALSAHAKRANSHVDGIDTNPAAKRQCTTRLMRKLHENGCLDLGGQDVEKELEGLLRWEWGVKQYEKTVEQEHENEKFPELELDLQGNPWNAGLGDFTRRPSDDEIVIVRADSS